MVDHDLLADDFKAMATRADQTVELLRQEKAESVPESEQPRVTQVDMNDAVRAAEPDAAWNRPTALLNTRIPVHLAEGLDDLVYTLRKIRRQRVTKQDLAAEAIADLLAKYPS